MANGQSSQWKVVLAIGALIPVIGAAVYPAIKMTSVDTKLSHGLVEIDALRKESRANRDLLIRLQANFESHKREQDIRLRPLEAAHGIDPPK